MHNPCSICIDSYADMMIFCLEDEITWFHLLQNLICLWWKWMRFCKKMKFCNLIFFKILTTFTHIKDCQHLLLPSSQNFHILRQKSWHYFSLLKANVIGLASKMKRQQTKIQTYMKHYCKLKSYFCNYIHFSLPLIRVGSKSSTLSLMRAQTEQ